MIKKIFEYTYKDEKNNTYTLTFKNKAKALRNQTWKQMLGYKIIERVKETWQR